jgi:2'-5' RNA ligase
MRTFITLEFSCEIKEKIREVQTEIRHSSLNGRFKHIDNFHLTLKFLGETRNDIVRDIKDQLREALNEVRRLKVRFCGIGGFGTSEKTAKTIYIDAKGDIDPLKCLAGIVEEVTCSFGFKKEGRFTPHITIAQDVSLLIPFKLLKSSLSDVFNEEVEFDRVVMMKSEQVMNKRIYTPIEAIYLK